MRAILLLTPALLAACGTQGQAVSVTTRFWQAAMDNDARTVSQLITVPQHASYVASGDNLYHDFTVDGRGGRGVRVTLSGRFCYPDLHTQTILSNENGEQKVDLVETLKQMRTDLTGVKPLRKYCYPFKDQPLRGKIAGKIWQFGHASLATSQRISLFPCQHIRAESKATLILNLDLDHDGGNLSPFNTITIALPGGSLRTITEGSYRVQQLQQGRMQLQLSFKADDENYLSGSLIIEQPPLTLQYRPEISP